MWEGYLAHNRPNFARLHGLLATPRHSGPGSSYVPNLSRRLVSFPAYRGRCPDDFTDVSPKCTQVNHRYGPPPVKTVFMQLNRLAL